MEYFHEMEEKTDEEVIFILNGLLRSEEKVMKKYYFLRKILKNGNLCFRLSPSYKKTLKINQKVCRNLDTIIDKINFIPMILSERNLRRSGEKIVYGPNYQLPLSIS